MRTCRRDWKPPARPHSRGKVAPTGREGSRALPMRNGQQEKSRLLRALCATSWASRHPRAASVPRGLAGAAALRFREPGPNLFRFQGTPAGSGGLRFLPGGRWAGAGPATPRGPCGGPARCGVAVERRAPRCCAGAAGPRCSRASEAPRARFHGAALQI